MSSKNPINRNLIYLRINHDPRFCTFRALHINGGTTFQEEECHLKLKPPQCIYPFAYASCNGLILFTVSLHELAMLNPSTREYKKLPRCPVEVMRGVTSLNFGHDSSNNDYKVLVMKTIKENYPYPFRYEIWIFGFKSGSWRRLQDFLYRDFVVQVRGSNCFGDESLYEGSNCFVDGALHFLCYEYRCSSYKIVAFDVTEENFSVISAPISIPSAFPNQLQVVEGCLCLRLWHHWLRDVNICIRKKCGDKFTWVILLNVKYSTEQYFDCLRSGELLGYSKGRDKLLFLYDKNIYSYGLVDGILEKIETMNTENVISKVYCIGS
ncbi:hypothetical protein M5689_015833 [Euphorbia peplus]|nr:hypothetical protein M5689_015833 [Euphorbia peplus]